MSEIRNWQNSTRQRQDPDCINDQKDDTKSIRITRDIISSEITGACSTSTNWWPIVRQIPWQRAGSFGHLVYQSHEVGEYISVTEGLSEVDSGSIKRSITNTIDHSTSDADPATALDDGKSIRFPSLQSIKWMDNEAKNMDHAPIQQQDIQTCARRAYRSTRRSH
jgi:hypothetical protein